MIRSVEWSSGSLLSCAGCLPADVVLCVNPGLLPQPLESHEFTTIDASLVSVATSRTCGCENTYRYTIEYNDADLLAPTELIASDVTGLFCKTCFTQWVEDLVISIPTENSCLMGNTNTVYGCDALDPDDVTNTYNVAVGLDSGGSVINGSNSTFLGSSSGKGAANSQYAIGIGDSALLDNTGCSYTIAIGRSACSNNTSNSKVVAIGDYALSSLPTSLRTIAIGYEACVGGGVGSSITDIVAVGYRAGYALTTGSYNIAVGSGALQGATTATYNVAVGIGALGAATGATYNVAVGKDTLYYNTSGRDNVAIGTSALVNNTSGNYNVAVGHDVLSVANASYNVAIGYESGYDITTGAYNVAIGYGSMKFNNSGGYNVAIGYQTRTSNWFYSVAIGYNASVTKDFQVVLGGSSIVETKLRRVLLAAGAAAVGSYPIKFTSGTLLTAPEAGTIEYDGTHFYMTTPTGRQQITT